MTRDKLSSSAEERVCRALILGLLVLLLASCDKNPASTEEPEAERSGHTTETAQRIKEGADQTRTPQAARNSQQSGQEIAPGIEMPASQERQAPSEPLAASRPGVSPAQPNAVPLQAEKERVFKSGKTFFIWQDNDDNPAKLINVPGYKKPLPIMVCIVSFALNPEAQWQAFDVKMDFTGAHVEGSDTVVSFSSTWCPEKMPSTSGWTAAVFQTASWEGKEYTLKGEGRATVYLVKKGQRNATPDQALSNVIDVPFNCD